MTEEHSVTAQWMDRIKVEWERELRARIADEVERTARVVVTPSTLPPGQQGFGGQAITAWLLAEDTLDIIRGPKR